MKIRDLGHIWLVMPVYNEEESIVTVVEEWSSALQKLNLNYTFLALNDGSKDQTLDRLKDCEQKLPNIKIVDKPNTGHGQTCVQGYRLAIESNADWVFQIDSDGQCDPQYFTQIVRYMPEYKAVFGYRKKREDGFSRFLISRVVSLFAFAATGVWLKDANVPYRMIHRSVMEKALSHIPSDFFLANILLSVLVKKQTRIKWVDIIFRDRIGGSPSIKTFSIMKHGAHLYRQLRQVVKNAKL